MTSFTQWAHSWSRSEAESFLAAWRQRAPGRSDWFRGVVADTGPPVERDAGGFEQAWAYLCERGVPADHPLGPEPGWPEWYVASDPLVEGLTASDAWLVDGLVFFLGDVFMRRHQAVHWDMSTEAMLVVYQQPILAGFWAGRYPKPLDVLNQALRAVHRIRRGDAHFEEWPGEVLTRWGARATPPDEPADAGVGLMDFDVIRSQHSTWDLEIWIDEGAEAVLGPEVFRSLPDRLSSITAISELAWEDREVFLVRLAHPADIGMIAEQVAVVLRTAARKAKG